MIDIKITITGPGETFGLPLLRIARAMEELGYNVIVDDPYPYPPELEEKSLALYLKGPKADCLITAEHCPWGG